MVNAVGKSEKAFSNKMEKQCKKYLENWATFEKQFKIGAPSYFFLKWQKDKADNIYFINVPRTCGQITKFL